MKNNDDVDLKIWKLNKKNEKNEENDKSEKKQNSDFRLNIINQLNLTSWNALMSQSNVTTGILINWIISWNPRQY